MPIFNAAIQRYEYLSPKQLVLAGVFMLALAATIIGGFASSKSRSDIKQYIVVAGDSVSTIASKLGVTSDSIMWWNNLRSNSEGAGLLSQRHRADKAQVIASNDVELTGLKEDDRALIPNGQQPAPVVSRPILGRFGYNGYDHGFCTWHVANRRAETGRSIPSNLGNASSWDDRAAAMGLSVNKSPAVGDAVVTQQRGAGHVAFVESVNADGSVWVTEMNSRGQLSITDSTSVGGRGRVDWKLIPASTASGYSYIH